MRTTTIVLAGVLMLTGGACSTADDGASTTSAPTGTTPASAPPADATGTTGSSSQPPQGDCTEADAVDLTGREDAELEIEDFAFHPDCFMISKGQALEIRNRDDFSHTFTVDALDITIPVDGGSSITMANEGDEPKLAVGTNPFHCSIHPQMTGTVIVSG